MAVYRAQSDGRSYLYAATFGQEPAVWRSATGEPGSWENVWSSEDILSVRWMAPHKDLLYIATSNEFGQEGAPAQIWATDGDGIWPVVEDGFGNPDNKSVMSMISYNGWLYAGTSNAKTGYEIWKLAGPDKGGVAPVKIVDAGGPDARNQAAGTPFIFQGRLYYGSLSFLGTVFKGCDLIRIDENDDWETVVGPDSISGYRSGFNRITNMYLWWMAEHEGWLYASTWDAASVLQLALDNLDLVVDAIPAFLDLVDDPPSIGGKRNHSVISLMTQGGADLYKSRDGVCWEPVFKHGLGDPYNYGLRTMVSVGDYLYAGMANPFDGLEVWRAREQEKTP